jgi:TPR repeat protein
LIPSRGVTVTSFSTKTQLLSIFLLSFAPLPALLLRKQHTNMAAPPSEATPAVLLAMDAQGDLSAEGLYLLGEYYFKERGEFEKSVGYIQRAADQGFAKAQSQLGACLQYGTGVATDETEANGVAKDVAKAVRYYRLAADQGDAIAQYRLGQCLFRGLGVVKDQAEAARYYRLGADQGDAAGQYQIASCLSRGCGVPKDDREAARYFRMAAEQGDPTAQFSFAGCLIQGMGVAKDEREAAKYFRLAADQGEAVAQYNLAMCLTNGSGIEVDLREAVRYTRLAAEQGFVEAQFNLGVRYNEGIGVDRDPDEAARWLLRAAKQRHRAAIDACHALGFGRKCGHCGTIGLEQDGLRYCAGCKKVAYCSPEHQRAHWKTHKPLCRREKRDKSRASKKPSAEAKAEAEFAKVEGNEAFQAGCAQQAVYKYSDAIALDPSVAVYFANRAAALQRLNEHKSALADCEKATRLDPGYRKAYTRKGHAHTALGQFHEAVEAHETALRLEPDNATLHQALDRSRATLAKQLA